MDQRLKQQFDFIYEIDKIKQIFRKTRLFDNSRYENDAEHAWHISMMAMVFAEYAESPVDTGRVIQMLLIHDLVEIDAGDVIVYDKAAREAAHEKEKEAARRIFGLLPPDQGEPLKTLWEEFEERETPDARFAAALDRMEPILQNYKTGGHSWEKYGISIGQVREMNAHIARGSKKLWEHVEGILEEAVQKGYLIP